jgi:hypothetical protein
VFAFSRAGGGGGSHGGSGGHFSGGSHSHYHSHSSGDNHDTEDQDPESMLILICYVIGIYAACVTFLYYIKPWLNKRKMKASFVEDSFWDHDKIIDYSNQFYQDLQKAWSSGSLLTLRDKISPPLYRNYMGILNKNKVRGVLNIVENVEISKTGVIYFDDYFDNSKDTIAILIQGQMKDYYSRSGVIPTADKKPFKDAYVFIRKNNQLILDEIINEPDFYQITKPKNYIETT